MRNSISAKLLIPRNSLLVSAASEQPSPLMRTDMIKQPTKVQREYWEKKLRQYNLGEDRAAKPRHYGRNGNVDLNVQLTATDIALRQAPPSKCFDWYAVSPERWPILHAATDVLSQLRRVTYKHSVTSNHTGNGTSHQFCTCGCTRNGSGHKQDKRWGQI